MPEFGKLKIILNVMNKIIITLEEIIKNIYSQYGHPIRCSKSDFFNQLRHQVMNQIKGEVWNQVGSQIDTPIFEQVYVQVGSQIKNHIT
jgi:hypothetical protein